MNKASDQNLTRRERQIMDVLYHQGKATVAEVLEALPEPPGYSAVRALLRILEKNGHVRHVQEGPRYVYQPAKPRSRAARSALQRVVQTFFGGSVEQVVATLVSDSDRQISDEELERLAALIEEARKGGR